MKLIPIEVERVHDKGTHQGAAYCTKDGALEKEVQEDAKFPWKNDISGGSKQCKEALIQ